MRGTAAARKAGFVLNAYRRHAWHARCATVGRIAERTNRGTGLLACRRAGARTQERALCLQQDEARHRRRRWASRRGRRQLWRRVVLAAAQRASGRPPPLCRHARVLASCRRVDGCALRGVRPARELRARATRIAAVRRGRERSRRERAVCCDGEGRHGSGDVGHSRQAESRGHLDGAAFVGRRPRLGARRATPGSRAHRRDGRRGLRRWLGGLYRVT
mmetsp:Transcript_47913/g.112008  ORF Transcript_47913/g.112008 Transcript_47913/m.112008 type:complete len:218 (+) Transcript_47913:256-909(+)